MSGIKIKIIFICTAVVLLVLITSGSIMLQMVRASETQKARVRLKDYAERINDLIIQNNASSEHFNAEFASWDALGWSDYDVEGCILNALGIPIAPFEFTGQRINDSAVVQALSGSVGFSVNKNGWIIYAMPVSKAEDSYVIMTRMRAQAMNENLSTLTLMLVLTAVISIVLTGLLWSLFATPLTEPIVALTRHAKEIAGGNLNAEISVHSRDEIGQLSTAINIMAKELHNTLSTMASEKNKSEALLYNMTDGVLAYDAGGQLTHANAACGDMLPQDFDLPQADLPLTLSRLGFDAEAVYKLTPEESKESTFPLDDRYITASVNPYRDQRGAVEGFIIVLQDVTRHTKLDNMRKEFVANVSHELRTPLTSIKTYAETLMDGAIFEPENAMGFLKVIDEESQRMSLLVSDLLELSRLDDKQSGLEKDVVDLAGLMRLTIRQNRVLAERKNQRIDFTPPIAPYFIEANATRINQVITNIITNSVKYSPEGARIAVSMEETSRYYRVFVQDNGIGVPAEDLPHIFDRFYRVDKARSRSMGGTGLGLAIAKEIMEEHGGRITASSEAGKGTIMVLRFNRYRAE